MSRTFSRSVYSARGPGEGVENILLFIDCAPWMSAVSRLLLSFRRG